MKKAIGVSLLLLMASIAVAVACEVSMNCPIHDGSVANFTGTRFIDGVLVGVYHCPRGHDFIARCN